MSQFPGKPLALAGCLVIACLPSQSSAWQITGNGSSQFNAVQGTSGQPEVQGAAAQQPQLPPGFPLEPRMQEYVDQLLQYWEKTSDDIKLYQCDFRRWEYDPEVCNWVNPSNNHLAAKTLAEGKIRYARPDKGMFEVTRKWHFVGPPVAPQTSPQYQEGRDDTERWICDGEYLYQFDFTNKRINDMKLPAHAQGQGLQNSPLPFVFGANAADLKERYWIRDVTPSGARDPDGDGIQDQYWLEAWPKTRNDAEMYQKVDIILSAKPFLPEAITIYAPNYDQLRNPTKAVFTFDVRKINGVLDQIANFWGYFVRPRLPDGSWERVEGVLYDGDRVRQMPHTGLAPTPGSNRD